LRQLLVSHFCFHKWVNLRRRYVEVRILDEKARNLREGTLLRAQAAEEMEKAIKKEERKRATAIANNVQTMRANQALKAYKVGGCTS
jgi:hypothetical protein